MTSRHIARLFDSGDSRTGAVAAFVAEALDRDHNIFVVAKPAHWTEIASRLTNDGYNLADASAIGRLLVLNAFKVLAAISRDGQPSASLFEEIIGTELRRRSSEAPLWVYGEIVEVLAERAEFSAALKLEELWNRDSEIYSFTLLCGYSSAHFVGRAGDSALEAVCRAHGRVYSDAEDPLGRWILQAARD